LLGVFFESLIFFSLVSCHKWRVGWVNPSGIINFLMIFFLISSFCIKLFNLKLCHFFASLIVLLFWERVGQANLRQFVFFFSMFFYLILIFLLDIFFVTLIFLFNPNFSLSLSSILMKCWRHQFCNLKSHIFWILYTVLFLLIFFTLYYFLIFFYARVQKHSKFLLS
jgi:hypothetical protein